MTIFEVGDTVEIVRANYEDGTPRAGNWIGLRCTVTSQPADPGMTWIEPVPRPGYGTGGFQFRTTDLRKVD